MNLDARILREDDESDVVDDYGRPVVVTIAREAAGIRAHLAMHNALMRARRQDEQRDAAVFARLQRCSPKLNPRGRRLVYALHVAGLRST